MKKTILISVIIGLLVMCMVSAIPVQKHMPCLKNSGCINQINIPQPIILSSTCQGGESPEGNEPPTSPE